MKKFEDIIKIKAEVLCWGLKTSKAATEIYHIQYPRIHRRTGNVGIQFILEDKLVINAIYGENFCENSPYHIEYIDKEYWLCKNEVFICKLKIIKPPKWYNLHLTNNVLMADIILQEGIDTLISGIWNNCVYFKNHKQCKFCIIGYEKGLEWKNLSHFIEVISAALEENQNYYLHLTGGNTNKSDHGIIYYKKYVKAIKKEFDIPVSIEISPPEDINYLESIISAGVDGLSINIELWDEKKRRKICPGKSQIRRELYYESWKKGVNLLGKDKISSVMIIGLETPINIEKGIKEMVRMGVKPVLIPFRPFDKCALNHFPTPSPVELLQLSAIASKELKKSNANEKNFVGCEHCGACSLEKDFFLYDLP